MFTIDTAISTVEGITETIGNSSFDPAPFTPIAATVADETSTNPEKPVVLPETESSALNDLLRHTAEIRFRTIPLSQRDNLVLSIAALKALNEIEVPADLLEMEIALTLASHPDVPEPTKKPEISAWLKRLGHLGFIARTANCVGGKAEYAFSLTKTGNALPTLDEVMAKPYTCKALFVVERYLRSSRSFPIGTVMEVADLVHKVASTQQNILSEHLELVTPITVKALFLKTLTQRFEPEEITVDAGLVQIMKCLDPALDDYNSGYGGGAQ